MGAGTVLSHICEVVQEIRTWSFFGCPLENLITPRKPQKPTPGLRVLDAHDTTNEGSHMHLKDHCTVRGVLAGFVGGGGGKPFTKPAASKAPGPSSIGGVLRNFYSKRILCLCLME